MSAEAQRLYRQRHPERIRESDRRYVQTEGGRLMRRRAQKEWKDRHPEWTRWHNRVGMKVWRAVKRGLILKLPCEVCGGLKVQAHHYLGYEPEHELDVMWLCSAHHSGAHHL